MVDQLESLALDETTILLWIPQQDRSWTETPEGDIELAALATEAYYLNGVLALTSETLTFNRADELSELFEMVHGQIPARDQLAYLQLDDYSNVWIEMDRPFVKKFTGQNQATLRLYGTILGGTADYQDGYDMDDLDIVTNDWNL